METIEGKKVSVGEFKNMLFDDNDEFYYEILEGEIIRKSAPTPLHQRISRKLLKALDNYVVEANRGEMFSAPIDVYLDDYNKPQPDLVFVSEARKSIVTGDGIMSVPDLIVEIISPTSIIRDRIEKKTIYERFAVTEFWLADPQYEAIEIYTLQNNRYELHSAATTLEGELKPALFTGLTINLSEIFCLGLKRKFRQLHSVLPYKSATQAKPNKDPLPATKNNLSTYDTRRIHFS